MNFLWFWRVTHFGRTHPSAPHENFEPWKEEIQYQQPLYDVEKEYSLHVL